MYYISKTFGFEAAHHLSGLPPEHLCSRHHGHSYKATLHLKSDTVDGVGFVYDYRRLDQFKQWIDDGFDHRDLNTVLDLNPTAENLAKHFYDCWKGLIPGLYAITVKETEKTEARYEP